MKMSLNALRPFATRAFLALSTVLAMLYISTTPVLAQSVITTYAGGLDPYNGAPAISIRFDGPRSVISDGAGGFYFAVGYSQNSVYRVAADGTLTVIAGTGVAGSLGDGGPATSAQLNNPYGLTLDGTGNLLIAEHSSNRIRKVTPAGVISTVAGTGSYGFSGDGGPATSAQLNGPVGIIVDADGNLLIADGHNHRVRKVTPAGVISTVAGIGTPGFSGDGGPAVTAQLNYPAGVAVDGSGNLLIADYSNNRIRSVTPAGVISTVAGSGATGPPLGNIGDNGPAVAARLQRPHGIAVDGGGNLLIADTDNYRVRRVTPAGVISTVAGTGSYGFSGDGGSATFAELTFPLSVSVDAGGNLLIADVDNYRIRKVTPGGVISTVAGNGIYGYGGDNGPAVSALLNTPNGVAADAAGNLFIADTGNFRIRKVTPEGVISTFAGNGLDGFSGDGGPATLAALDSPAGIAAGPDGTVYIADCSNRIRKVSPDGAISTFATGPWSFCAYDPYDRYEIARGGLAVDAAGNVFVADTFTARVYKVTPGGASSVVAGTGAFGFSGDNGPATSAQISEPRGIALDQAGNLYIADAYNNRIRKVTPAGTITTVAGDGTNAFGGDGGPATSSQLDFPTSVTLDAAGNLFIADSYNYRIRKVTLAGIITTVAGNGTYGSRGDGGLPTLAQLSYPLGVAVNTAGNLFIADTNNHRIRKVNFALTVPTLADLSLDFAAQGATFNMTLVGTSFAGPLNIDAGSGITVSNVTVMSETQATATFTIAPNAAAGSRNVNVTTSLGTSGSLSFNVVPPFPDLSISSSTTGNFEVGFNGTYTMVIANGGLAATTEPITVTDDLPSGLNFVSGTGSGWTCSASGQNVTCANPDSLAPGSSTTLTLTVAVDTNAPSSVTHSASVTVGGDLIPSDNVASTSTNVATAVLNFQFNPATTTAGTQATLELTLPTAFAHDVTGTLTLSFAPNALIQADDPAIQFSSGGRTVSFTIPANTVQARFGDNLQAGPIAFQTGTVAGDLSFSATLQTGSIQTAFSSVRTIPRGMPTIHTLQNSPRIGGTVNVTLNLSSTAREVTQLVLQFSTYPAANVGCGSVPGCVASGNSLTLDVKPQFDVWFLGDTLYGSTSSLSFPLSIEGTVGGSVIVRLRNSIGTSNGLSFLLP